MAKREIETCFNYCTDDNVGWFSSNEKRWINKIRKYAHERPDQCIIIKEPEVNNGFIYAKLPQSWLYVRPPKKHVMTEEQKLAGAERLRKAREAKND